MDRQSPSWCSVNGRLEDALIGSRSHDDARVVEELRCPCPEPPVIPDLPGGGDTTVRRVLALSLGGQSVRPDSKSTSRLRPGAEAGDNGHDDRPASHHPGVARKPCRDLRTLSSHDPALRRNIPLNVLRDEAPARDDWTKVGVHAAAPVFFFAESWSRKTPCDAGGEGVPLVSFSAVPSLECPGRSSP